MSWLLGRRRSACEARTLDPYIARASSASRAGRASDPAVIHVANAGRRTVGAVARGSSPGRAGWWSPELGGMTAFDAITDDQRSVLA